MNMTIRSAYSSHPFLLFFLVMSIFTGVSEGGAGGFISFMIIGGFSGLLLLLSVKSHKYIFKDGLLTLKHWNGPSKSVNLNSVQRIDVKPRTFASGDIILDTPSGKFKIKGIKNSQQIAETIERTYISAS